MTSWLPDSHLARICRYFCHTFGMTNLQTPENSPLGKPAPYKSEYDPSLLFPIPRQGKRDEIGISGTLPFFGIDLWNAYEVSWLNQRGKPQIAIAAITIPADSTNII